MSNLAKKPKYSNIANWGDGFFSINQKGNVQVNVDSCSYELNALVKQLQLKDINLPCLLEFPQIVNQRVKDIYAAFDEASKKLNYQGNYSLVYPIKVNQKYHVVKDLYTNNPSIGLESGSKAELCAILSIAEPGSLIVCNGYKDLNYLTLSFLAANLGYKVYVVIEKISEVEQIIALCKQFDITPNFGVRARLSLVEDGKGQSYSGIRAKFGLNSKDILTLVDKFKANGLLHRLKKLHCHMGTQLCNLTDIYQGVSEIATIYVQLKKLGANLDTLNLGGGLAIDYDGTGSNALNSKNYSINEYAHNIISKVHSICNANKINDPHIFTESGRGIMAHASVFVFQLIDLDSNYYLTKQEACLHPALENLYALYNETNLDSNHIILSTKFELNNIRVSFIAGNIDLATKAKAEEIALGILHKLKLQNTHIANDEVDALAAHKYYGNFSIFRSLPDIWAIDQIFPVMPLSGMHEADTQELIIADITCDSDGVFHSYANDSVGVTLTAPSSVKVHDPMAVFLVGAYQDILGDDHNLYGRTNAVRFILDKQEAKVIFTKSQYSVLDTLKHVNYDIDSIKNNFAAKSTTLNSKLGPKLAELFEKIVTGATYLNV